MNTFEESGLKKSILSGITELGYEKPTPVQEQAITHLMESKQDLIALAQTGTGKTAAFGLPILHQVDIKNKNTQALILCPTRELCIQITKDILSYSKFIPEINIVPVYGGSSIDIQIRQLKKGAHIVVGTPGRTLDLIKRKRLNVSQIKWLVLDEADEMLSMGFSDDLDAILATSPKDRQTMLFSATMPKGIVNIAKKYMNDRKEISIGKKNVGAENVNHEYFMVHARDRYIALKRIVDLHPNIYAIVFCRTRAETKDVSDKLGKEGYNADALHGDLSQAQRDHVMGRFREKTLQLLIATDVAARGLDVHDLTHVINYNLPDDPEIYVHRSGRTGRAGKSGISIAIIHTRETRKINEIERIVGKKFDKKSVPSGKQICEKQLFNLIDKVEKITVDETQIEPFLDIIDKKLSWLSREDLIKHFVSVEFNRFLNYYKNAPDINVTESKSRYSEDSSRRTGRNSRRRDDRERRDNREHRDDRSRRESGSRRDRLKNSEPGFSRLFINLGIKDDLKPTDIIAHMNNTISGEKIKIGKIDIHPAFSFFEVDEAHKNTVLKKLNGSKFNGITVSVETANPKKKKRD